MTKTQNFEEFIKSKLCRGDEKSTHTRIGDKDLQIHGGAYTFKDNLDEDNFLKKYFEHVFINGNQEYLTEKQLLEGPIVVDLDLHYDTSITDKQHTEDHIIDLIILYADKIAELVEVDNDSQIEVFVMEKKHVNCLNSKTKDGIHILFGITMHKALQVMLRNKVLNEINVLWDDLPIINTWDDVLDIGITKGMVNWQLYGSRKPGNEAYLIKYHYTLENDDSWSLTDNITQFNTKNMINK